MAPTFQEIIFKLQDFWGRQGCSIIQSLDMEVGAGTFHPATFLRAVSPEPWQAAYVQPSRRPQDGRYGENPNRLQHYYQFQVAMKPSPPNFQALFMSSLDALSISHQDNDIRFVEDDWESPTLGAWGLGWEVWINGMECAQFTYFQEAGGFTVQPVLGEITYGLERLAMFIQKVDNVFAINWNGNTTYGDIYHQNEVEQSTYNFSKADVSLQQTLFDQYEQKCLQLVDNALPLPAYEMVMKCSHAFNLLDARGVISNTERHQYIGRVRRLAKKSAKAFYQSREKLNFPLLHKQATNHEQA